MWKHLQGLISVVCFLGILLLGFLSLTEHYVEPITDSEVERIFTIPPQDSEWKNERLPAPYTDTTG